ncbi:ATP-binding cassette domain-containing protein [Rhabdobacter roseus]|uniref:Molybdate transport system ATP-binding protein n=1 Tax=Rhabdobacter roseus TaxID=1655419 RepID=A0A840U4Q7_9BACT|nr:ATP-binding cassette domain-containing protein [Rhabdobacter roseus]MBB5287308.1 molybdate transport system ATP-binding protein [Rhabdobacter roseus]
MHPIDLENVTVRKYDTPVLFELSWRVLLDEQWVVLGGNGSGKTTLLETLAGRWAAASGKVKRTGTVELVANDYSFHRIVQAAAQYYQQRFQAQEAEIAPTVREVLTGQLKPIGTVDERSVTLPPSPYPPEHLTEIAQLLRLQELLDQPFITLSNGETRRMLLARSLLRQPDILLLDHPFVGLDVHSRQVLREALAVLATQGVTLVLATSPGEVPDCMTHALLLHQGRIVQHGAVEDVKVPPSTSAGTLATSVQEAPRVVLEEPEFTSYAYAFRLRKIKVVYHGKAVLDELSWDVKKGEKWALMGPNGSGKSTLLSILTADHPQRFANDYDLFDQHRGGKGTSIWDIKGRIGHVSPELHLYFPTEATVFKTIASGFFDATGVYFRTLTGPQTEQVGTLAQLLGVGTLLDRPFRKLSKGEQRRVLLARALVKNPPLLILDEPCQGLDIASVEHFKYLVDTVCSSPERTLVYVSHYPHEIPSCVTHRLELHQGKVV